MRVPQSNSEAPIRLRRASRAVFTSRDLPKFREFYTEVIGLVVASEDKDTSPARFVPDGLPA